MRIAITGAQSTGKSTLLRYLKQDDDLKGFEFIDELTRKIAAKGININEEGSNMSQIFTVTIHAENIVKDHFISDRCALDGLVYTKWLFDEGKVDKWILDYAIGVAKEVIPRYDYIFYLPAEIPIEDDGIRSADIKFRDDIVALFEKYTKELGVKLIELSGSVKDRAKLFKRVLEPKLYTTVDLKEVSSLSELCAVGGDTDKYLTDAYNYWVESGYSKLDNSKIYLSEAKGNAGWAFVREEGENVHLSRFTVEFKGDGLGGKMFNSLKKKYKKVTLWSNPEAVKFYERLGVIFTDETTEVDGSIYTYGYYE
jgi:nicotinamide riboside kinase